MSLHITRFLDRIRAAESRQQRDISMTVIEARDLHADITRLLLQLQDTNATTEPIQDSLEVKISGGEF